MFPQRVAAWVDAVCGVVRVFPLPRLAAPLANRYEYYDRETAEPFLVLFAFEEVVEVCLELAPQLAVVGVQVPQSRLAVVAILPRVLAVLYIAFRAAPTAP